MNAAEAFVVFVTRVLVPGKARRFAALTSSKKGQRKILEGLCHEFEPAVRPAAIRGRNYNSLWTHTCFAFHSSVGFGVEFPNVRNAYEQLSVQDSWLILLQDASAGIHRPEARWDDEKLIA
jgi:hypothetical protein